MSQVKIGTMRIDLERVPAAIAAYQAARNRFSELTREAQDKLQIRPMGQDDVSKAIATEYARLGLEGQGSTVQAIRNYVDRLDRIIAQLDSVKRQYGLADVTSGEQFPGAGRA